MRVDLARITDLRRLQAEIPACRLCPRLNGWRERIARDKVARFRHWDYWSRPVPSLGQADARLLVVGLAPAAHGANRTGRMFTGDRSGEWLYRALHRHGFASHPESSHRQDPLRLIDCYITDALLRPTSPARRRSGTVAPTAARMGALTRLRVVLALGRRAGISTAETAGPGVPASDMALDGGRLLVASFHPTSSLYREAPDQDSIFREFGR